MTFDNPNVTTLKNKCLSTVAENFQGFKSKLTSRYIFGSKKIKSPCKTYKAIDEETWCLFVQSRTSEEWKTHAQEKIRLSKEDPLGALQQLADIIGNKPLEVEYDANVFGRGSEVPIYLHSQDVRELASGTEELNITLVQLWMMYMFGVSNNLGYNDVYGFIDSHVIHETNDFDEITTYLTRRFASGKNIFFIPYISGLPNGGRGLKLPNGGRGLRLSRWKKSKAIERWKRSKGYRTVEEV
ncbi:hypothetical protein LR48_Vigan10g148600 [Vigna angularis]|uniref:Uncharacterized protein n=1 Tax=Phaseolus angularis TaxID=3914 RepID=A0A0L9VLI8_PHAAN|nr:hypothetical protein LR48_Vigan10g148600 [Vigna angularis]